MHAHRNRSFQQPDTFEYKTIRRNQRWYHSSRTFYGSTVNFFSSFSTNTIVNWTFSSSLFSFSAVETTGVTLLNAYKALSVKLLVAGCTTSQTNEPHSWQLKCQIYKKICPLRAEMMNITAEEGKQCWKLTFTLAFALHLKITGLSSLHETLLFRGSESTLIGVEHNQCGCII